MDSISGGGTVAGLQVGPEGWSDSVLVVLTGDVMGPDDGASCKAQKRGVRLDVISQSTIAMNTVFMAKRVPARVQSIPAPGTDGRGIT